MHSGAIPDSAITASSSYDSASVGPSNGRCVHFISHRAFFNDVVKVTYLR